MLELAVGIEAIGAVATGRGVTATRVAPLGASAVFAAPLGAVAVLAAGAAVGFGAVAVATVAFATTWGAGLAAWLGRAGAAGFVAATGLVAAVVSDALVEGAGGGFCAMGAAGFVTGAPAAHSRVSESSRGLARPGGAAFSVNLAALSRIDTVNEL